MNRIGEYLESEHALVRRAAACLDRLADAALDGDLPIMTALDLLEFFEHFVDGAHQEREERCLFPRLLGCGLSVDRLRRLLVEHADDRAALVELREDLARVTRGDPGARREFAAVARALAAKHRVHADVEDALLLPFAEELLDEDEHRLVLDAFEVVDATMLPKPRRHYVALVESAAERLGAVA